MSDLLSSCYDVSGNSQPLDESSRSFQGLFQTFLQQFWRVSKRLNLIHHIGSTGQELVAELVILMLHAEHCHKHFFEELQTMCRQATA